MILVGNSRGGACNLAAHLMKDENDHVHVHELRGFAADNLHGALNETYAISRGTKCQKFLFSLSLNPPPDERVETPVFEDAIDRVEDRLGLSGQPRAIVFHEKDGRRHAHAVWSRIDAETMTAKRMDYSRERMQDVARELYREHGWRMPEGFADRSRSAPRSYTLEQWQQAKRVGKDAGRTKEAFQDAWAISDNKVAFEHALKERGYYLAKGDRRGFVAVDVHGEVYSVPKQAGVKTRQVKERLGDPKELPSLDQARDAIARDMGDTVSRLYNAQASEAKANKERFAREKQRMVEQQRAERAKQMTEQEQRQQREQAVRQERFRKGLRGLWDRITGQHKRISERNAQEFQASQKRDQQERDRITFQQLQQRRALREQAQKRSERIKEQVKELAADRQRYLSMRMEAAGRQEPERSAWSQQPQPPPKKAEPDRVKRKRERRDNRSPKKDRGGPSMDR